MKNYFVQKTEKIVLVGEKFCRKNSKSENWLEEFEVGKSTQKNQKQYKNFKLEKCEKFQSTNEKNWSTL